LRRLCKKLPKDGVKGGVMKSITNWKILLVEDGSVNLDELKQEIKEKELPIIPIIYRQGARPPHFLEEQEQ